MNSINKKEIEKFSKIAEEWWDPNGKFKPLHNFNPIRIRYIKENIIKDFKIRSSDKPLKNIKLLDIGCGGGLLSEPMCRLGASVVGIDASKKNIEVAKFHAKKNKLKIDYKIASPEMLKDKKKFDVILNMEIVEHVNDIDFFIKESSKLLKKNGIMFIATLNKTLKSYPPSEIKYGRTSSNTFSTLSPVNSKVSLMEEAGSPAALVVVGEDDDFFPPPTFILCNTSDDTF